MSQTIEKEIVRFSHSESIQLVWPDDYIAVDSSYNNDIIGSDQESLETNDYQPQGPKQRQLFRPQVTVNVYSSSSGGSSAGGSGAGGVGGSGSGAGGSGTGGQATVNGGGDGDGSSSGIGTGGIVSLLVAQVADLFRKVDQLSSLQSSSERIMVESGIWSTQDVRPWQRPEQSTNAKILFSKPFKSTPRLITSITGADVSHDANFRVKVYATSITERGFIIHADSWAETKLYACEVSWMAAGV